MHKKVFPCILGCIVSSMTLPMVFAADTTTPPNTTNQEKTTIIYTTEEVPGGNCVCVAEGDNGQVTEDSTGKKCLSITTRKYKCTVPAGLSGFQLVIGTFIRWMVYIVMLLGVLGIVGLGIAWSFAGGDDVKMKSNLKTWGINILVGLIILFLFRYILQFLAPWIYR